MAATHATAPQGETPVKRAKRGQANIGQYFFVKHSAGPQRRLATSPTPSPSQPTTITSAHASGSQKPPARQARAKLKTRTLKSRQMYLDLGQRTTRTECKLCGMVYFAAEETDVKAHQAFHDVFQKGVKFQLKTGEKDVLWRSSRAPHACILRIRHASVLASKARKTRSRLQEKIEEVHAFMDRFLGQRDEDRGEDAAPAAARLSDNGTTYMWVQDRRVIGCVEAEHIEWGMRVTPPPGMTHARDGDANSNAESQQHVGQSSSDLGACRASCTPVSSQLTREVPHHAQHKSADDSTDSGVCLPHDVLVCSQERVRACVGVRKMWVHSSQRRRGIAQRLVDAARAHTIFNYTADTDEVAFSSPTADGQRFAAKYCRRDDFLVYKLS